jgi:hypothetical protein
MFTSFCLSPFGLLDRFDDATFETVCSHFACSIYANQPQIQHKPSSYRFLSISSDTSFQRRDDRQHIRIYDCGLADIQAGTSTSHITQKSIRSTYERELGKKAPAEWTLWLTQVWCEHIIDHVDSGALLREIALQFGKFLKP